MPIPEGQDELELLKLRLDYAWRYFESAARQRMLFFNYFLIAVGILASAIGFGMRERLYWLAAFASFFGFVASVGSIFFDIRMLAFVNRARRVLDTLERAALFPDGFQTLTAEKEGPRQLGLARTESDHRAAGKVDWETGAWPTKVKLWIRLVECLAVLGFLATMIWAVALLFAKCCQ